MIEKQKQEEKLADNTAFLFGGSSVTKLRIIFMGTPEFAVASLKLLVESGHIIVAVITAPDKPGGRGLELQQSAVKQYAVQNNLLVMQPEKLKDPTFLSQLQSLNADLQIVVAFRMLPEVVWTMPAMGTVNLHGSLLPQYRGAAPINWAIINGEKETGVTTFKLKHEIDTGDVLLQESFPISDEDTAGTVHDKMKEIGAKVLLKTIEGLALGTVREKPQNSFETIDIKHAPKIFSETCKIEWRHSSLSIFNLIRGLSPYPAAFTEFQGKNLKIFSGDHVTEVHSKQPGSFETDHKTTLKFATSDGWILVKEIQLEGKKRMSTSEFLRGFRLSTTP